MNVGTDPAFGLGRFGHQLTFGLRPGPGEPAPETEPIRAVSIDVSSTRVSAIGAASTRVHCVGVASTIIFGQESA